MRLTEAIIYLTSKKKHDIVQFSNFEPTVEDEKLRKEYQRALKYNRCKKKSLKDLYDD